MLSLVSTVSLEPEPIPLNVKVVLVGERVLYYLLYNLDPDFHELFKVAADFEEDMDRSPENQLLHARLIATTARRDNLLPLDREAVARRRSPTCCARPITGHARTTGTRCWPRMCSMPSMRVSTAATACANGCSRRSSAARF
jgi:hypothetical protein